MGKIISRNQRVSIASSISSALNTLWSLYAATTTAVQLPSDVERLRKMMADPPFELPYILAAISLGILLWSFWPSKGRDDMHEKDEGGDNSNGGGSQSTGGNNSPNLSGTFHGDVNINSKATPNGGNMFYGCNFIDNEIAVDMPEGANVGFEASTFRGNKNAIVMRKRNGGKNAEPK